MDILEKIVVKLSSGMNYNGWRTIYDDGRVVFDKDVASFIKEHSRIIDRLNPMKMVVMTNIARDMLAGYTKIPDGKWRFK